METQSTIRALLEAIANTNLVLKEQINKIESDILSFDEFITEHKQPKKEQSFGISDRKSVV